MTTSPVATLSSPTNLSDLPPEGRAALRAGVVGNWIDNIHVFLPLTALAPAMLVLAGPAVTASTAALVVVAMLFGRPLGGLIFGRLADRLGRTRTTRIAVGGTATCALAIAAMPTYEILGGWTIAGILVLRFLGGIFVAGQYSAAIPLAMEWSTPRRRGLMSGMILSMAPWAQASIAFAVTGLLIILGPETYATWGWRVLFVIGALLSIGLLIYYGRQVTDAPVFQRQTKAAAQNPGGRKSGLADVLTGRWAPAFWQVFLLMTGLWLLTNTTVLLLTERLGTDTGFSATNVSLTMGIASVAQAIAMACAGHLSTYLGRRNLFLLWGLAATLVAPGIWWFAVTSSSFRQAVAFAALLQIITVAAYGPVSAYLSERFPTEIRSTGYGMAYSFSLILPALYPFYLPLVETVLGRHGSVMALVGLGGILLVLGAVLGPKLAPRDISHDIDAVAANPVAQPVWETN